MNVNEYFHIGNPTNPVLLEADEPIIPEELNRQYSGRATPTGAG